MVASRNLQSICDQWNLFCADDRMLIVLFCWVSLGRLTTFRVIVTCSVSHRFCMLCYLRLCIMVVVASKVGGEGVINGWIFKDTAPVLPSPPHQAPTPQKNHHLWTSLTTLFAIAIAIAIALFSSPRAVALRPPFLRSG